MTTGDLAEPLTDEQRHRLALILAPSTVDLVASVPPPTPEQCARLAALLGYSTGRDGCAGITHAGVAEPGTEPPDLYTLPTTLYRLFDANGVLLYVGISANPDSRIRQHRAAQRWRYLIVRHTEELHPTRDDALAAERAAIEAEQPMFNRQHRPEAALRRCAEYVADKPDVLQEFLR